MERLRKVLSIFAAAALLAPAGGALAGRPVFHHHRADHEGEEKDHQSDRGAKPAKVTESDLTLRSRALRAKDGKTQLEISTAPFDIGAVPPGNISHVRVRAFDPSRADRDDDQDEKGGKGFLFRQEYKHLRDGGSFTRTYPGLDHGLNLRIEAKARGATHRDEVEATLLDVVRYRPDMVVTQINSPAQVFLKRTIDISAIVKEGMGDLGAHMECVLFIDDKEEDVAQDAWVDASGSTECAFTATFPVQGRHMLTVRARNTRPGDYDESNNAMSVPIDVINPIIPIYTATVVETTTVTVNTTDTYNNSASVTPDTHEVFNTTNVAQNRSFIGTIPNAVSLSQPLKFTYSDSSGGRDLSKAEYLSLALDSAGNFIDKDTVSGRTLCIRRFAEGAGSTQITFKWDTADTTTFSRKTCSSLNLGCVAGDFTASAAVPANVPLANDYSAAVVLDDGTAYTAQPTMALEPFGSTVLQNVNNSCVLIPRTKGGRRCTLDDTASYGKKGGASLGGGVSVLQ